jgi:membrane-bound ClpP family serine protease
MSAILSFVGAALVLVFFEVILPGGVLGVMAALCVLVATWFGFDVYGLFGAITVFLGTTLAIGALVFVEFKFLARTGLGKMFFLNTAVHGHTRDATAEDSIIGKEGKTLTRLCPCGKVAIEEKTYEAHSQDGYMEPDQRITVVSKDNFKLIIKKI